MCNNFNIKNLKYDEYIREKYKNFVNLGKIKENFRRDYFNRFKVSNSVANSLYSIDFSFKNELKKQVSYYIQRVMYLQKLNENKNQFFITFTLPSEYHPFRYSNGVREYNPNFKFNSIEESIKEGREYLYNLWRSFYLSLKNDRDTKEILKNDNLSYFGMFEPHKTYVPHFHLLVYASIDKKLFFRKWNNFLKRVGLNPKTNKLKFLEGVKGGSLYVSKYLQKIFYKLDDDFIYFIVGWKSNITRMFYSSRLSLRKDIYQKIYYNLPEKLKEFIEGIARSSNTSIYMEISKSVFYKRIVCFGDDRQVDISFTDYPLFYVMDKYEKYLKDGELRYRLLRRKIYYYDGGLSRYIKLYDKDLVNFVI